MDDAQPLSRTGWPLSTTSKRTAPWRQYTHTVVLPAPPFILRTVSSGSTKAPHPLNTNSAPLPEPLEPTILFSVSVSLTPPGIQCKSDHTAFVPMCPAYSTEHSDRLSHSCCTRCRSNRISLCGWTTLYVSPHPLRDAWVAFTLWLL